MYLITEWEGLTGKYLARGHGVWTERSILSYDHRAFPFFFSGSGMFTYVAHFD